MSGERDQQSATSRRTFLRRGVDVAAAGAATLWLPACARTAATGGGEGAWPAPNPGLAALDAFDRRDGGADPFPIPWLDRNGSHNQSPEPGAEPSNIYHFAGRVARANDFRGMGTDGDGRRIPFGAKSTDFSFMHGEYWAGREARRGTFTHI
jgi:hypothetical protein